MASGRRIVLCSLICGFLAAGPAAEAEPATRRADPAVAWGSAADVTERPMRWPSHHGG